MLTSSGLLHLVSSHLLHDGFLFGRFSTLKIETIRSFKRRFIYGLYGAISLKRATFTTAATSDPTKRGLYAYKIQHQQDN
jgi:hypothetical protein